MQLEKQVVSLELSKKLKELGVEQESHFMWAEYKSGGWNPQDWHWVITDSLYVGDYDDYRGDVSAFTVAELLSLLDEEVIISKVENVANFLAEKLCQKLSNN